MGAMLKIKPGEHIMTVQSVKPEPATTHRVQRHRRSFTVRRNQDNAPSIIRGMVRRSATVDDAIAAVTAIDTAWANVSPATQEAIALMLTILELSDNAEEASAVFARLHAHLPTARTVLDEAKKHISEHYPGSEFRLEFGEEDARLGMTFFYVLVPAADYPSFKQKHDQIGNWWCETFPDVNEKIVIAARRARADV